MVPLCLAVTLKVGRVMVGGSGGRGEECAFDILGLEGGRGRAGARVFCTRGGGARHEIRVRGATRKTSLARVAALPIGVGGCDARVGGPGALTREVTAGHAGCLTSP
ncbi:MAG: hypothetical protein AMXMBFR55_03920 [Gemmatimonadota bacterium]